MSSRAARRNERFCWRSEDGSTSLHLDRDPDENGSNAAGKFDQDEEDIKHVLRLIGRVSSIVRPRRRVTILHDEPDNRILECAAEAEADVAVSGDRHLLKLRRFEGTSIIRLSDFFRMFPESREA